MYEHFMQGNAMTYTTNTTDADVFGEWVMSWGLWPLPIHPV
jgi:hypothetical protein